MGMKKEERTLSNVWLAPLLSLCTSLAILCPFEHAEDFKSQMYVSLTHQLDKIKRLVDLQIDE
jgi:hypothetical protein